jgi:hypothetical protein
MVPRRFPPGACLGSRSPLDVEAIDEPDAGYDVVLCREGLMFAVDPVASRCLASA